jgi:hypothetical protein
MRVDEAPPVTVTVTCMRDSGHSTVRSTLCGRSRITSSFTRRKMNGCAGTGRGE